MRRTLFWLTLTAVVASVPAASAQRPMAQLTLGGGSATDVRGVRSSAVTAAPLLAVAWPNSVVRLGVTGTSFSAGGWAVGAGGAGHLRTPIGSTRLAFTFDASLGITATSYRTSFFTAGATPAVELAWSRVTLFGGARAAQARVASGRTDLAPQPSLSTTVTRRSLGPVFGGQLAVATFGNGDRIAVGYREERARVNDTGVIDRAGTISLVRGPIALTGILGSRRAPDEATTLSGVTAAVALSRMMALHASADRYASDRLTGALGGRSINVGLVFRTASGPRSLPRPHGIPAPKPGLTRLAIRAPDARAVEIAGDWTNWQPVAARQAPRGVWYADLAIPPGEYRYAFRIDGKEWRIPDGAVALDDGLGGKSAWLTVHRAAK